MGSERGYLFSAVVPAFCAIIFSAIYGWTDFDSTGPTNCLTDDSSLAISILPAIYNALIICLLSILILLNRLDKISTPFTLSAISWLVLPGIWICYLLVRELSVFTLINTVPYLVGSLYSFSSFRKTVVNSSKRKSLEIITRENRKIRYGSNSDSTPSGV